MKNIKTYTAFTLLLAIVLIALALDYSDKSMDIASTEGTDIHLYGETHGIKDYYNIELSEWNKFYDEGYRNLFIELPYYTAEYLNLWMKVDTNDILDSIFEDMQGTLAGNADFYDFLQKIKETCPETIFYGTDVGHQYSTTGNRYLSYLEESGFEGTEQYKLTQENIDQGIEFYSMEETDYAAADSLREDYMVSNFEVAYKRCGGGKIMGIYGSYHTDLYNSEVMASKLSEKFPGKISAVSLNTLAFNKIIGKPYDIGFCLTGLVFLLMLFVPNLIWAKKAKPQNYEESAKEENKILLVFERIGEILVSTSLMIFTAINPKVMFYGGLHFQWRLIIWLCAFVLMIFYECYWIKYFKSPKTMADFYSTFAGFPVAGATLPVLAVFLLGLYSKNLIIIVSAIILGIGHIGIHLMHFKAFEKEK